MIDVDLIIQDSRTLDFRSRLCEDNVYHMLSHMFKFVQRCFADNDLEKLNYFIENVDFQDSTTQKIVAVLRSTYSRKLVLASWITKYNEAIEILESRNLNSTQLLRGLNIEIENSQL